MDEPSGGALIGIVMSVVVLGILFMVTRMGASGEMGPNGAVGIRTKATKRSDAAWRAGHAAALPVVGIACLVILVVDFICCVLIVVGPESLTPWLGLIPAVGLLIAVVPTVRAANKGANSAPTNSCAHVRASSTRRPTHTASVATEDLRPGPGHTDPHA